MIRDPAIRKLAEAARRAAKPKAPPGYAAYLRLMRRIAEARRVLDGEDTTIRTSAEWAAMHEREQKSELSHRRKQERYYTERLDRHNDLVRETAQFEAKQRAKREAAIHPSYRAYHQEVEEYLRGRR